jgi:KaiC/GvpD/RAD55 family RecA-like ATPase
MQYVNGPNIPQELKDRKQWVLWRTVKRPGGATKVPFSINGTCAKSNDPTTWDTYENASRSFAIGNWDGIGFVFSADDPYTGIDLDGCRNPETGIVLPWAKEIILQLATYAEVSPSKTGVKLWVRGNWPFGGGKLLLPEMERIAPEKSPAIEVYFDGRFFTVTGAALSGQKNIGDRQEQLDAIRTRFWKDAPEIRNNSEWRSETSVLDRARKYLATIPGAISGSDGHGATFKAACSLVLGFDLPDSDALNLLSEWNQTCQPPWSERELKHKVESASQSGGDRGYLRNASPKNYERIPVPEYREPQKKSEPPKSKITITQLDKAAGNYLDAVTNGKIRLMELGLPDLDYAIGGGVEPGEMVIFAARPGHAKSLAAQQVSYHFSANGIPVAFFSEEMSNMALGKRAIQFATAVPNEHWTMRKDSVSEDIEKLFRNRSPIYVVEGCRTAERVADEIGRMVRENGVGLAVVDYAQLLGAPGKTRVEVVTNVSIALKQAAKYNQIPLIVLCQMNRAIEGRGEFMPVMADLKESGQLEQDADVIIFQVWCSKVNKDKDPHDFQFIVAKNKSRPINQTSVECRIKPERQMLVYANERFLPSDVVDNLFDGKPDEIGPGINASGLDIDFGP